MTEFTIEGATVLLPDAVQEASVCVEGGIITGIGEASRGLIIDGRGLTLAPALIDVHGDAFERQIMPRPGVFLPLDIAILETDRQLAANGIATAYHALTFSWEPGLRNIDNGRAFIDAVARLAPRLTIENRIQLRWETFAFDAIDTIEAALDAKLCPSLAFNDHTSMGMRSLETPIQERLFEQSPDFAEAQIDDPRLIQKMGRNAQRANIPVEDYMVRLKSVWDRRKDVDGAIRRLAAKGRAKGAPMLSHDDTQVETREYYRAIGATVTEFPMTIAPTRDARAMGDTIIFGAPNVLRGGSHIGSLGAADMVEDGLCDALASDYYYPALLAAVARLDAERRASRTALWSLVSSGPARAMNLSDRGEIALGKRADLVFVDWPDGGHPSVRATYSAGREAYAATPSES